jgi:poly(3-hydroxyalkanoate) synthetase
MLAMLPWLTSLTALPHSKNGWKSLSMPLPIPLPSAQARLKEAWEKLLADPLLTQAVEKEARKRAIEFLEGLHQYQSSVFARDVSEPTAVFAQGSARLLHYGTHDAKAPAVFLVPSLINRYYILDLTQRLSFARYLSAQGLSVYIIDWGEPSAQERHYNCGLYVTETLIPIAEWIRSHTSGPLIASGYCMGGLLTMALVQLRPDLADACAFLATPWDFFAPEFPRFKLKPEDLNAVEDYISNCDMLPAETIHTLFHCANPYAFQSKLRQFARMDKNHPFTQEFLAIEHWVNDGVPMARGVAHDCIIGWTQQNAPALGRWRVGGQAIDPANILRPSFLAVPQDDRIVPVGCAQPLSALLKGCTLVAPNSGHVGMMVGHRRKAGLWEPFAQWIDSQFT